MPKSMTTDDAIAVLSSYDESILIGDALREDTEIRTAVETLMPWHSIHELTDLPVRAVLRQYEVATK